MSQTLIVKLTPNAKKNAILGWDKDEYNRPLLRCSVTTIPEDGKANAALIKLLSKHYKIAKSAFTLTKGHTSRIKHFDINTDITFDHPK